MKVSEYFPDTMPRELFNFMTGEKLGEGVGRHVFEFGPEPQKTVIKFEIRGQSFQNIMEWEIYKEYENQPEIVKWFAPCLQISPCGMILLQRRTVPLRGPHELPPEVPHWLSDLKMDNWGLLDGKPVMHDYGFFSFNLRNKKMRKHPLYAPPPVENG